MRAFARIALCTARVFFGANLNVWQTLHMHKHNLDHIPTERYGSGTAGATVLTSIVL